MFLSLRLSYFAENDFLMNKDFIAGHLINADFFKYIKTNIATADVMKLILKSENCEFDKKFAVLQIECRNKYISKLPEILLNEKFLFPKTICGEQCTHETIAKLHASMFHPGENVLDMTMGLGIDTYYISKIVESVDAIEYDEQIAEIAEYNFRDIASNIKVYNSDSVEFIKSTSKQFSTIFIDPARRDANNKRMFGFHDCQPDVIDLLSTLREHSSRLIIKASPMLDIKKSIDELRYVSDIWIVAIKNSCKELLFVLDLKGNPTLQDVTIHTINYDKSIQEFDYMYDSTAEVSKYICENAITAGKILLEPNSCIIKGGRSEKLIEKYPMIEKISKNSHLFVSDSVVTDFPGRQFVIDNVIPFKDKNIKSLKSYKALNVSTRNFKLSAEQLKSKLGVKDGGENYLFGTTLSKGSMILVLCSKL